MMGSTTPQMAVKMTTGKVSLDLLLAVLHRVLGGGSIWVICMKKKKKKKEKSNFRA